MRAVVQRVHKAECVVDGEVVSKIEQGLVAYIGVFDDDTDEDMAKMANKISGLRVFRDEAGKLSLNASAVGGSVMLISNFVLAGRVSRGFRPDCTHAAKYDDGKRMFDLLAEEIGKTLPTVTGVFGAHMDICVHNDGPINVIIDTRELRK
ncbi:MAG: D-tyrosyl-tRNA(Tyr) deacylase [Clostridia bacterium]|nr:D-tyrosyl-tRNA(Tyr) deacylase [Clostridia bacterium]